MNSQLLTQLPALLPLVVQWALEQETQILATGTPLSAQGLADATAVGVKFPAKIRLLKVASIPLPSNPILRQAAISTNLITPHTAGMTLRYGIFIRMDCWDDRELIAHECVHTAQYERLGGFAPFLAQYLHECISIGYPAAPLEQEAVLGVKKIYA